MSANSERFQLSAAIAIGLWLWCGAIVPAADWPTYQHDMRRSAITEEQLPLPLAAQWVFRTPYPPEHAWGDPQPKVVEGLLELPRMRFDDAFHIVAADNKLFFGASSDNKVYALDAAAGTVAWEFYTESPVRMAPTVWQNRVYAGSDDGKVYCLRAEDGSLLWAFQAAPTNEMVLSSGRMASLWPVRTGVIVVNDIAYFGAGVFPGEGLYLYALNAQTGAELWRNDTYGRGGDVQISPQGYMVASRTTLFMPSGRSIPAAFSREDGRFLFHRNQSWRSVGQFGGTYAFLADDLLFNGTEQIMALKATDGGLLFSEDARLLVVAEDNAYLMTGKEIVAVDRKKWREISRKRLGTRNSLIRQKPALDGLKRQEARFKKANQTPSADFLKQLEAATKQHDEAVAKNAEFGAQRDAATTWRVDCPFTDSLILAGTTLFAGGDGAAKGYDVSTGKEVWTATFEGKSRGLAVADGRLYVTTDRGTIHCFGGEAKAAPSQTAPQTVGTPYPAGGASELCGQIAERIVNDSGIRNGFALLTGGGNGCLAYELARRTEGLLIHMVEPDAALAEKARRTLTRAGVYGGKVIVLNADLSVIPYSDYFANLIVCGESLGGDAPGIPAAEVLRMLKPCGGVAYVGQPTGDKPSAALTTWTKALQSILDADQETDTKVSVTAAWGKITRGKLPGAGDWTHQYGTPGNTASSDDTAVKAPIGILWYGEPGPGRMPSRHASNAAPLSVNGRFFVQGENVIMTHDAYNGAKLWEREVPGALRVGLKNRCSNLAAREDSLFVVAGGKCLRLDTETGETLHTYSVPLGEGNGTGNWGEYIACVGDLLYGSYGGNRIFAVDVETGALRWAFDGSRVLHVTICIDQGKLFFVDYTVSDDQKKKVLGRVDDKQRVDRYGKAIAPDIRRAVALDATTGKLLWEQPQYLSDCVRVGAAGGEIVMMASQGVVLICGQPWNGHFWKEFFAGDFTRRSLIALSASDGHLMWSGRKGYRSRPLIVDGTVYAEPWSHDLHTGAAKRRINPLTGGDSKWQFSRPGHHCGNVVGSPNMLFFRSYSLAYYDLLGDYGTAHFGAQRTGCWINTLPANGLVMMPEASSSCQCAFPLQCTMVFNPRKKNRVWGMYSVEGGVTPIKHLGINFGAPGDRKSADGALWLSWPRPQSTRLVLTMAAEIQLSGGGSYTRGNDDVMRIANTDVPWIYTSGAQGLQRIVLPLVGEAEGAAEYTVRLLFAETDAKAKAGSKPFDVKIQGKVVATGVDVLADAGSRDTALVKDFSGIRIDDRLVVEFVSKVKEPTPDQLPTLRGLEVVRERVLQVGLTAPSFVTSNMDAVVQGTIRLGNFTEKPFAGKVSISVPEQFKIEPATCEVDLKNGERKEIPVTLTLVTKGQPATLPLVARLLKADGTTENESQTTIDYLGKRGRSVVTPSADAYVNGGSPTKNSGYATALLVDGGAAKFGDNSHNISYLKFPIDVPGKAVAATFRIYVPAGGHTQSADSGVIKIADNAWDENSITYKNAPKPGAELAKIGKIDKEVWIERKLNVDLTGLKELTIVLDPTSCDGATYVSREGPEKPELVIEYGVGE